MRSSSSSRAAAIAIGACLAILAAVPNALAFCRTTSCKGSSGTQCTPSSTSDCGVPLAWSSPCVSFDMQSLTSLLHGDRIQVRRSANQVRFLHPRGWSYYATLRRKLRWYEGVV